MKKDLKTKTATIKEYLKQELKEIYPNLKVDEIKTESRYNNQVALKFNNINVVNYNATTGIITYYNGSSSPYTLSEEEFEIEYPTAYGALKDGTYTFAENGDLRYHDTGVGTKIVKKIEVDGPYQPFAITGGEIQMTINYETLQDYKCVKSMLA